MDDLQHPLVVSTPPLRGPVESPAPMEAQEMATNLKAHRGSMSLATTQFEQQPPVIDSKVLRGRSKSLAFGIKDWNPRLPMDYFTPAAYSSVPYQAKSWEPTLERAIRAIVSIKASHVRSFDTETSGKSIFTREKPIFCLSYFIGGYTATGFIVDAARGIILTNRHVVSAAPIVAQAVLTNYEEVDLKPVYRDPVHDFGFMQVRQ